MSGSQCIGCEYEQSCWSVLKLKNRLSSESCGNFRKRKVVRQTTFAETAPVKYVKGHQTRVVEDADNVKVPEKTVEAEK